MPEYKVLTAGDTALVIEFGDGVDRRLSGLVLALAHRLGEIRLDGIVETVPTFRSLMVHYDPLLLPGALLTARIVELMDGLEVVEPAGREWRLPVCYDAEFAPDLGTVAAQAGLTPAQAVERHSAIAYHVYMLGFLPGQAYMGDVPAELALARREIPRPRIPAGSLAIALTMCCIFPRATPCGWHLIGRSPVALWQGWPRPGSESRGGSGTGALLAPGDKVMFAPISLSEYEQLATQAAAGMLQVLPVNAQAGVAA
jgi:inhibitor of KinA